LQAFQNSSFVYEEIKQGLQGLDTYAKASQPPIVADTDEPSFATMTGQLKSSREYNIAQKPRDCRSCGSWNKQAA
jgi:hypothetical protein